MDLQFSEEQLLIQQTARDFARDVLAHNIAALDKHEGSDVYNQNLAALSELGFMGMLVDDKWDGSNVGSVAYVLAVTEIGRVCPSTAVAMSINNLISSLLNDFGSEQQKQRFLQPLCSGQMANASFALTESAAGSNPAQMQTSAKASNRDGVQGWEVNGTKQWITNGAIADFFVVWARTDPEAGGGKGISCLIVERDNPGLSLGPNVEKMGQRGNPTNEVILQDCFVPESNIIGAVHQGFRYAIGGLVGGRLGVAALALGIATEALEFAGKYMLEREQSGKAIIHHQGLQWQLAESYTELEAARLLLLQAAWRKDAGLPYTKQTSMAKLYCTDRGNAICYHALQMLGGYGYVSDFPMERFTRDIRITSIYEGTSEIQKLIIGRELVRELQEL